jgi:hypothetical protein
MNYEEFAQDLPAERTMTFRSAEENEEFFLRMNINQEMRQLRRGPFRSDLAFRTTQTTDLYADRFSSACRMYLEPPPGMVGLLWLRSTGAPLLASGVDSANDKLLFLPSSTVVGLVLPDLAGSEVLGIPEDNFKKMLATFCPGCEPLEILTLFEGRIRNGSATCWPPPATGSKIPLIDGRLTSSGFTLPTGKLPGRQKNISVSTTAMRYTSKTSAGKPVLACEPCSAVSVNIST